MSQVEKSINGVEYTFKKLPIMQALSLEVKLAKILGPGISIDFDKDAGEAFSKVAGNLDPEETPKLIKNVVTNSLAFPDVTTDDRFESHFKDRITDLHLVFIKALEVNFGGLVAEFKKKFGSNVEDLSQRLKETKS